MALACPFLYPYFIHIHLTWAQELCIYMFVWMAKFGAAYGVRTGIHVGVDVALRSLDGRSAFRVILFGLLCGAICSPARLAHSARTSSGRWRRLIRFRRIWNCLSGSPTRPSPVAAC